MITIKTNLGDIKLKLDKENTPATAENFIHYAKEGHYNDTVFHRVIDNFMIQGGGFKAGLIEKPSKTPIENEADKAMPNKRGTIAMARTSDPHSATSQFFINVADNEFLNHKNKTMDGWGYCAFGEVIEGMDVVDKIKAIETGARAGHHDVPTQDIVINEISVE